MSGIVYKISTHCSHERGKYLTHSCPFVKHCGYTMDGCSSTASWLLETKPWVSKVGWFSKLSSLVDLQTQRAVTKFSQ